MGWLSNAVGTIKRTLNTWASDVADWFETDQKPGDARTLQKRFAEVRSDLDAENSARNAPGDWNEWDKYAQTLRSQGQQLLRNATQQVVNRREDPTTQYGAVVLAICYRLYRAQADLCGDHWHDFTPLDVGSIVLKEQISSLDWPKTYRILQRAGFREAKTLTHGAAAHKFLDDALARVVSWCKTRAPTTEGSAPRRSSGPAAGKRATSKNSSTTSGRPTPPEHGAPGPVDFQQYMERIRKGEKLPVEEQNKVVSQILKPEDAANSGRITLVNGLAGTGKTVILAMVLPELASRFQRAHGRPPRILVYHFNNYLRTTLMREINSMIQAASALGTLMQRPDLVVANYWDLAVRTHKELRTPMPENVWKRDELMRLLLKRSETRDWREITPFDIALVDEGQDLLKEEYRLLSRFLTADAQLVVAFDDFQNIMSGESHRVRRRVLDAFPDEDPHETELTTCVRSNPVVFSLALSTLLGPSLNNPEEREAIERAVGIDAMRARGDIEEIPWPGRSGRYLYGTPFCLFPKGPPPRVVVHADEKALGDMVEKALHKLVTVERDAPTLRMTVLVISIVNGILERLAERLGRQHKAGNLPPIVRRSGKDISGRTKRTSAIVEPGVINLANVQDAKGAEADVVFVIDPDSAESRAPALQKRALFYVAATRAKVLLQVDGLRHGDSPGPIMSDALDAFNAFDTITKEENATTQERVPSNNPDDTSNLAGGMRRHFDNHATSSKGTGSVGLGVWAPAGISLVTGFNADAIIDLTRGVDAPGSNLVDAWMDQVPGSDIAGGFGHRFLHGHGLTDVVEVYDKFGLDGVWKYAQHLGRDLCTPHGLPLPGGQLMFETANSIPGVNLNLGFAVEWLSFNIADLLSASFGALSLVRLAQQTDDSTTMFVASGIKLAFGVATSNPVILVGAMVGGGVALGRVVKAASTAVSTPGILHDDLAMLYDTMLPLGAAPLVLAAERKPSALLLEPVPLRLMAPSAMR